MNYGKSIKELRVGRMKQNQNYFSENIGITQSYLSQVENGTKKPSTDLLEKISEYVGIPMPILFWKCIEEQDVKKDRIEAYRLLKPTVDVLISSFF